MTQRDSEARQQLVIVPSRPGPLLDVPAETARQRDDLDDLLDDLFGEPTREGAGLFDIALIVSGTALAVAAGLAHLSGALAVAGAAMIALGLVLPVRDLWHRAARRQARRRVDAVLRQGFALNMGDPVTRQLAAAYRQVTDNCARAGGLAADVLESAHLAMVEVCDVLQGRPPRGAAEEEYAITRVRALDDLAQALSRPAAGSGDHVAGGEPDPGADGESVIRGEAVAAIRRLEERTGASSVSRIGALRRVLTGNGQ